MDLLYYVPLPIRFLHSHGQFMCSFKQREQRADCRSYYENGLICYVVINEKKSKELIIFLIKLNDWYCSVSMKAIASRDIKTKPLNFRDWSCSCGQADCVKIRRNTKIRSCSLPSYERLKKILLPKYRHGFCIFVKMIRAKVDKNNKNRAEKKWLLSSFIYSIGQHLIADHSLN